MTESQDSLSLAGAAQLLGVSPSASTEAVRAAYLQAVQKHPPDRDPDGFEKIRDAYNLLRDPDIRASAVLQGPDPLAPLTRLLDGLPGKRAFVGVQLWMQLLKEKRT